MAARRVYDDGYTEIQDPGRSRELRNTRFKIWEKNERETETFLQSLTWDITQAYKQQSCDNVEL